jgi:surface antigen
MREKQGKIVAAVIMLLLSTAAFPAAGQWRYVQPQGFSLSEEDAQRQRDAALALLNTDPPPVGRIQAWSNPRSGARGTVTMLQANRQRGLPCRRLRYAVEVQSAQPMELTFTLCRTPEGAWKALD